MGTGTTRDVGGQEGGLETRWTDTDVRYDGIASTLGDEAHTSGQAPPMRAQQAHVKVTSPAKAHSMSTSTMAKHRGRLPMESARLSIPYSGTRASEVLQEETSHLLQIFPADYFPRSTQRRTSRQAGCHRRAQSVCTLSGT